ncbi:Conserved hypothetical protein [gamma proteobacterium HdN1]|nr:Conserved hypothetical protein [gamma proteobacterium HdN1]
MVKRAYEAPEKTDGERILVDRLWPRGLKKENADIDLWLKDVAPSTELRKWFGHDPEKWAEFQKRYKAELKGNTALDELREHSHKGHITLVFSAHDEEHNNAIVLQQLLEKKH